MKRSERLKPIIALAEQKERDAASALGFLKSKIDAEEQKKAQLQTYGLEYHQQIIESGKQGVSGATLRRHYEFMTKLNDASQQQNGHIKELEQQVSQVQQYWLTTQGKLRAFENLVEKAKKEEQLLQDKQEQKVMDELTSQAYARRHQSSGF